jgi:hypothetical protein
MKAWLQRLPFQESSATLFLLRLVVVLLVWDTHSAWMAHLDSPWMALVAAAKQPFTFDLVYSSQPSPNGMASWFDLTWLSLDAVERPLRLAALVSLLCYLAGLPAWLTLLLPTWFGILTGTLANSQGSIGHIVQVLHVTLLCLWLADLWRLLKRGTMDRLAAGRLQAHVGRQAIAAGYVVSALTKLYETGGNWIANARYAPVQMVKNNDMKFYQDLDPSFQQLNGLAQTLMDYPVVCQIVFGLALPLELFAFMGCRNQRLAWIIGLGLILLHLGILQMMSLFFPFNMGLLLAFFVIPGLGKPAEA